MSRWKRHMTPGKGGQDIVVTGIRGGTERPADQARRRQHRLYRTIGTTTIQTDFTVSQLVKVSGVDLKGVEVCFRQPSPAARAARRL